MTDRDWHRCISRRIREQRRDLRDLPTRQSSPFRRLSSTIRSHQNDCGRLHDCVSVCGMRYRNRLSRRLLALRYDDCTFTEVTATTITAGDAGISELACEFDAFTPTKRNEARSTRQRDTFAETRASPSLVRAIRGRIARFRTNDTPSNLRQTCEMRLLGSDRASERRASSRARCSCSQIIPDNLMSNFEIAVSRRASKTRPQRAYRMLFAHRRKYAGASPKIGLISDGKRAGEIKPSSAISLARFRL